MGAAALQSPAYSPGSQVEARTWRPTTIGGVTGPGRALRAPLRLRWRLVLGGVAGATSGILGDAEIRGAAWGVAPRRMRRLRVPPKLAPAGMGHSALHLTDQGELGCPVSPPVGPAVRLRAFGFGSPRLAPARVAAQPQRCSSALKLALQERDIAGS